MSRSHILILSTAHLCRNPRVLKEATTLGHAGYDVTVLSVSIQSRFEEMDRALMQNLPFKRVTLDYATGRTGTRLAHFAQRSITWLAGRLSHTFGVESSRSLGPAIALLRLARAHPADLTIAHTEIPLWVAQQLHREGRRVAVDLEDWYSEDLLFSDRQSRPVRLLRNAEKFALQSAAYVSVPSQCMADRLFERHGGKRPVILRNVFPLQPNPRQTVSRPRGRPRFIWFSQTIGPGRGLELFLAAWARTKQPSEIHLLGDERAGYREKLLSLLPPTRRADLHFIPLVPTDQLSTKLAQYDLGLALEPHWPVNRDIAVTNKIMQYLNAGLAVVATDTAGQTEVMQAAPDAGILVTAHETTEFAERLDGLLDDPERLARTQLAARAAAEATFSWQREAPNLLAAVESALR